MYMYPDDMGVSVIDKQTAEAHEGDCSPKLVAVLFNVLKSLISH